MVKEKSHLHSRTNPSYQDEPIMIEHVREENLNIEIKNHKD
jgi:hypothetical protein